MTDPASPGASTARGSLRPATSAVRRRVYLVAGLFCVGLAAVGAVVPGLPATIFLIAASYLLARSHPPLEGKLVRCPLFRPYLPYLDGTRPFTRAMRARVSLVIVAAVSISIWLQLRGGTGWLVPALTAAMGAVGVLAVWRWRRGEPVPAPGSTSPRSETRSPG